MLVQKGVREYLFTIVVVRYFSAAYGLTAYKNEKELTNEEKRGAAEEVNDFKLSGESSSKSKTEKRGLYDTDGPIRSQYGGGFSRPNRYGDYEPSGYDGGYPQAGVGGSGHSGLGYYDEGHRHRPSYSYPDEVDHRPGSYRPDYEPRPVPPPYGYEEERPHYGDHGVGGLLGHGMGDFKKIALKKILLPLAGLAILGVAAVASTNPVLLQLGVANGRRKRSVLPPDVYPPNPRVRPRKKN